MIKPEVLDEAIYGLTPPDDIALAKKLMRPEPLGPLLDSVILTEANFGKMPHYYIKTLADKCNTPDYQDWQLLNMPCKMVVPIYLDHAPFFSRPELGFLISDLASVSNG